MALESLTSLQIFLFSLKFILQKLRLQYKSLLLLGSQKISDGFSSILIPFFVDVTQDFWFSVNSRIPPSKAIVTVSK